MQTTKSVKPFLKWAGGKQNLIPQIEPYIPREYNSYYEPFLGGGAMFFHLQPKLSFLADINEDLINVYNCVRDDVEQLISLLEIFQNNHSEQYYYQVRSLTYDDAIKKAARFIYLNKTCFNGLYRQNKAGQFNVPVGKYANPNICDADTLRAASQVLNQASPLLFHGSYLDLMSAPEPGDFVYFDPPYVPVSDTSNFTGYHAIKFDLHSQETLAQMFKKLVRNGVKCLLSNSDTPMVRELYQEFKIVEIQRKGNISSKGTKRGAVSEVLVVGY